MCRVLRAKKASTDLKACSALTRILNSAIYRGSVGPWSLEKLREWDKPLESLYRKIHNCMNNYATELIYFDPADDVPGLGMPCLSDRCQDDKCAKIHRALTLGGDSAVAAEGCLLRLTRLCGRPIIAGGGSTIMASNNDYFASSLVEWGASAGRQLRFGGNDATGTVNQLLASITQARHPEARDIISRVKVY